MKKLICIAIALLMSLTFAACKNENSGGTSSQQPQEENMSGINSQVSVSSEKNGIKYNFEGYFSTVLPQGIKAEDKSINSDAGFFTVYDDNQTYMDVTYYETGTSEQEVAQKAKDIAAKGSASEVSPITVNGTVFYGVSMPDYGKTQYMGHVKGYDITLSVYVDINDSVVQSFIDNTVFTRE